MKKYINYTLFKFLIIGSINTIVYYILYAFFLYNSFSYTISVFLASTLGMIFSFKSFGTYVFYNTNNRLFFKFIGVYIFLFSSNIIMITLFNLLINNYYTSGLLAALVNAIFSYFLNRNIVFKCSQ